MMSWTLVLSLVTHIGAVKHLKVPNISTADQIPALIEEHSSWRNTLMDFSSQFSLPSTVSSTSNSHHLNVVTNVKNIKENFDVNHHHQSISHPSLHKFQLKWYMWSDYVRDLPGLLLLGILAVQGVVDHQLTRTQCCHLYGKYKNFHVNHHHHCISHPSWRNFQLKWYILMSATSQAFSSLLFLPSTVPSTTKPYEQKVGKWGIQEKGFYWTPKISSLVVCGLGTVEKNQICKTRCWLPLTISELARRPSVRGPQLLIRYR